MHRQFFYTLATVLCLFLSSCEAVKTGPNSMVIRGKRSAVTGSPWFLIDDDEKMASCLIEGKLADAEDFLKKGANANYTRNTVALVQVTAAAGAEDATNLLLKYGASKTDAARGRQEHQAAKIAAAKKEEARQKELASQPYRPNLLEGTILNMASVLTDGLREGGSSNTSSTGSSNQSGSSTNATDTRYENCVCSSDARRYDIAGSGYNTIHIRSSTRGTWEVTYHFGSTGYQMKGGGNLEGKSINVRWDGGRPASLKSLHGSGYNQVSSASRY